MLSEQGGRNKWVNVDELSDEAKQLIPLEPGEKVQVKDVTFEVQAISFDPMEIVLVPSKLK